MPLPESDLKHVAEHTADVWQALDGASIFLTGGTGFVGRWLAESLGYAIGNLGLQASLTILTRNPDKFRLGVPQLASHPAVRLLPGSMTRFDDLSGPFTHVIHAAVDHGTSTAEASPTALYNHNVAGTRHVLDFAAHSGARRFLYLSSGAVYGPQPPNVTQLPETHAVEPTDEITAQSWYGQAKRTSEDMGEAAAQSGTFEFVSARGFAFVGPLLPLDANFAVGNFLRDALAGGPITVAGDGRPVRSYLYAADMAIWLWTMLVKAHSGRAYNVGSPNDLSILDLANLVRDVVCPAAEIRVLGQPQAGVPAPRYVPSTNRAETELGLRPLISLADAVRRSAVWARNAQ